MAMKKTKEILYGLLLTGGKSLRMKKDKAQLKYLGKPQLQRAYELLEKHCDKVFLSSRREQANERLYSDKPQIHDLKIFQGKGPLGGILSAMRKYPKASWLILGCDLPFVSDETIQCLLQQRNRRKIATAFMSAQDNLPEPLCGIYETKSQSRMKKYFQQGGLCPRKFLILNDVHLIQQQKKYWLENINSPLEYKQAQQLIKKLNSLEL
jgi:molybdopterin-guanine dinucleotide biosynthesis protein A